MDGPQGYDAPLYGDRMADLYDELPTHPPDADAAAACLAALADDGPALELGVGTGRIALPLAARGVPVSGVDASEAMVAKLRAKPGGDRISVTIGDFADVLVDGHDRFSLIFIVYNTFFALCDADAQRRCFEHVAAHLMPGGRFLIEAFVPDPGRFVRDQHIEVRHVGIDSLVLSASRHDGATQRVDSMLARLAEDDVRTWPCGSGTPTHRSSISWPRWPASGSSTGGAAGSASRSRATASSTSRCTRTRVSRRSSGP